MYYISLAGRNYNIVIKASIIGGSSQTARFRSFLEKCSNTRLFPVNCNIDITYNWTDNTPGSGTSTVTLTSGSSQVTQDPSGYTLTSIDVTNIDITNCTYNSAIFCGDPSVTTTTTTTTTTSTTTTTTTTTPSSAPIPTLKYDQYSSSYNPSNGIWTNIGFSSSICNLAKPSTSGVNSAGSGVSSYLSVTGSSIGPSNNPVFYSAFYSTFINLYSKSFSYAFVYRPSGYNIPENLIFVGAEYPFIGSNFFISKRNLGYYDGEVWGPGKDALSIGFAKGPGDTTIYGFGNNNSYITIANDPKWYLIILTFDKNAASADALKAYVNLTTYSTVTGTHIPSPSTFFSNTPVGNTQQLGAGLTTSNFAAVMFWENKVLTAGERQELFNEYNSRYTLG